MQVKVVVPYYKNSAQLKRCTDHLRGQLDLKNLAIYDDSATELGFTRAVNRLLRPLLKDSNEYVIVLNQDCYLKPGAVDNMTKFMDEHPKCAIGGIKHFGPNDDDTIIHGGCTQAFPNGWHITGSLAKGECAKNHKMPWVNGACLIVRMDAIREIGLMDENYNLICSDSDWCYTARDRGWEVWYIADAECIHEHGLSASNSNDKQKKQKLMDTIRFRDKWITDGVFRELVQEIF